MNLQAYMGEHTPKRNVFLHGSLGEEFGKEFSLAVRSPIEAIKLLEANFPRKFFAAIKRGTWQIIVGGAKVGMQCTIEMCHFLFPKGDIHIVPVPEGSSGGGGSHSKGIIMAILGVALIATAFVGAAFLSGAATIGAGLGTTIFAGVTWGQVGLLGAALLLLGVAILLTPTPKPNNTANAFQSFFYSGAVNSDREGVPVPICYGRVWAGSVVIAGGIFDDQFAPSQNPLIYSSITGADNAGAWIAEGTNYGVNDDPNKLYNDLSVAGINAGNSGQYVRVDPPTPVGFTIPS